MGCQERWTLFVLVWPALTNEGGYPCVSSLPAAQRMAGRRSLAMAPPTSCGKRWRHAGGRVAGSTGGGWHARAPHQ